MSRHIQPVRATCSVHARLSEENSSIQNQVPEPRGVGAGVGGGDIVDDSCVTGILGERTVYDQLSIAIADAGYSRIVNDFDIPDVEYIPADLQSGITVSVLQDKKLPPLLVRLPV